MPLYEYQCQACGTVLEVRQKISDSAPTACSACDDGPLVKLVSKTSFILKGNGWYVTDFRGGTKNSDISEAAAKSDVKDGKENQPAAAPEATPAAAAPAPNAPPTPSASTTDSSKKAAPSAT